MCLKYLINTNPSLGLPRNCYEVMTQHKDKRSGTYIIDPGTSKFIIDCQFMCFKTQ